MNASLFPVLSAIQRFKDANSRSLDAATVVSQGKTKIAWRGLVLVIELPAGSVRKGISKDGKPWAKQLTTGYGHISYSRGADNESVDCFLGPKLNSDKVFVINQIDTDTGKFDEHKCLIGWDDKQEAEKAYLSNYPKGWKGLGSIREMSVEQFKSWLQRNSLKEIQRDEQNKRTERRADSGAKQSNFCGDFSLSSLLGEGGLLAESRCRKSGEVVRGGSEGGADTRYDVGRPDSVSGGSCLSNAEGCNDQLPKESGRTVHSGIEGRGGSSRSLYAIDSESVAGKGLRNREDADKDSAADREPRGLAAGSASSDSSHGRSDLSSDVVEQVKVPEEKVAGVLTGLGIPDRNDFGDLTKLTPGQLVDFIVQRHESQRAGPHYDYRFGLPSTGLYSWVSKHELPSPGERRAFFQQPVHQHGYGSFEGTLRGYGAGVVRRHRKGEVLITDVSPNKISFTTADERYPQRFVLLRPKESAAKNWLLVNVTPKKFEFPEKIRYDKVPKEQVEALLNTLEDAEVQPKVDGASALVHLGDRGIEVVSFRAATETGRPIVHTERVFGKRRAGYTGVLPKELVNSVLQGELYGVRKLPDGTEEILSPQEIGGLLNSTLSNTLKTQRDKNIRFRVMLYNVRRKGATPLDDSSYDERKAALQEAINYLDPEIFHVAEGVKGPEEAKKLWRQVQEGKHPLTREGIVVHPKSGKPVKAKLLEEQDVHLVGTFPGEGKYQGKGVGGFLYALEPGGPPVGRVGAGLPDELRYDAFANPSAYVGRVARVRSQGAFPSGALRAPSFLALHEDEPLAGEKTASMRVSIVSISVMRTMGLCPEEDEETERPPIVAIDLDGTLAEEYKKFDAKRIGPPREGAAEAVRAMKKEGWHIIIYTVRGDRELVAEWLDKHRIPYDEINENCYQPSGTSRKIYADLYIDDRAVDGRRNWDWLLQYTKQRIARERQT